MALKLATIYEYTNLTVVKYAVLSGCYELHKYHKTILATPRSAQRSSRG